MKKKETYSDFLASPEIAPPAHLAVQIFSAVHSDLHPAVWAVFTKLGSIQLLVGAAVLLFCPQFGVNLFPGMGLMALFMRFGDAGCMVGCGSVFLGASSILCSIVLRPEEIKVIRRSRFLQMGLMTLLSGGVFVCLASDAVISLGIAWVMGGLVGGLTTLELGWLVRSKLHSMR